MNYRKPLKTRTIIPEDDEQVETPCDSCEESTLKIVRVEVETHKPRHGDYKYLSVKLRCKCQNCGYKQTVQLVEMP